MDYQGPGPTPLTRTPVRGFPPARGQGQPAWDESGSWHDPGGAYFAPGDDPPGDDPPGDRAPAASPRARRRARRRGRRLRSRAALLAVGVLLLGGAALAGYKYLYEPRVNAPVPSSFRLPTTSQGSPDFDQALGKWQHIGTRSEDPDPLTVGELYPPRFEFDGASYARTAASTTGNCSLAVYGAQLQAALQSGHCSQVVRASYVSGDIMGTIGVVNLISAAAAQQAGQVTGAQEIIAPLSSAKGVTSKLGSGTGVVQAEIKGHYLILIWAEFTDLKAPSTQAARQLLGQFAANLLTGSANINLSTRMLTGKAVPVG